MDLARALRIDSNNFSEISVQVKLFKADLTQSSPVLDRRILLSLSLSPILSSLAIHPDTVTQALDLDFEEYNVVSVPHMSLPFKSFLCPLTKEVMKELVVLESSHNYERSGIKY